MISKSLVRFMLLVALIASGCATTSTTPYNPFKTSQADFYEKIKTIALAEIFLPKGLAHPKQTKEEFQLLIESKVRGTGFLVIPFQECTGIWKQTTESMGGYFDPVTGALDQTKLKSITEVVRDIIRSRFQADALLYASLTNVTAQFSRGTATWDGVSEEMGNAFRMNSGSVGALSLIIVIEDIKGQELYSKRGGIQVLRKISKEQFVPVPREEILNNRVRNGTSVDIALNPLAKKP